jgi:predicted Rossmann fold flavoprotein
MPGKRIAIVGAGAAGFFGAIACARANPETQVSIYERGSQFLTKVRISGGGRCNVTHASFEPRQFATRYPRGDRALISPLHRFSAADTVEWFESRGVKLKTEADGRMFPVTDCSDTIIECLMEEARSAGVRLFPRNAIESIHRETSGEFRLTTPKGEIRCDRLLLALGGCRAIGSAQLVESLGHAVVPPVPSLFSFHLPDAWLRVLPGVSLSDVEMSVLNTRLRERGPLLITHEGLSGPAVLRLSAWGARILHDFDYRFTIRINWLPGSNEGAVRALLNEQRRIHPNRHIANAAPMPSLPARLWEQLVAVAGINDAVAWGRLTRAHINSLVSLILRTELMVNGKSLNKDEFVTCGGVDLRQIDFKTMQSRIVPGLYFAGELLDIDGITGGFNFQAAWTTGWIAGNAMAQDNEKA